MEDLCSLGELKIEDIQEASKRAIRFHTDFEFFIILFFSKLDRPNIFS